MTVDVESVAPSVLVAEARVLRRERLSTAFVRVWLGSPSFADLGVLGLDTRFKLVFPGPGGELPGLHARAEDWYAAWRAMPEHARSPMRTYTVRDVVEEHGSRVLVVDLVVHEHGPQGPACRWALACGPGDVVHVVAPHRAGGADYGGTEFAPGARRELLLVADETAVPAVARILADVDPGVTGRAYVEVPSGADVLPLDPPPGIELRWVVRAGAEHGRRLVDEVRRDLGLGPLDPASVPAELPSDLDVEVWETQRHSSSGEEVGQGTAVPVAPPDPRDLYAWIAGESWLVKALRRSLVAELDVDRAQVAFMGYWREGVSMRS